jgi:RNA polymerase sigma-70 factor (ECF subfamily)
MAKLLANDSANTTDRDLVIRCQQGDCNSFRQLYRIYQQRVRSTLYQLCGDRALDDLVQEVFIRAWKGLPNLREIDRFSTWLYRISWNVAIDRRRQFAKQKEEARASSEQLTLQEEQNSLDYHSTPELMRLHYQDLVRRGLQNLSLEHRVVLVLHDLEDLSQKEVANILNIPVGTVKSRLFHARSAIKKFLQQQGVTL